MRRGKGAFLLAVALAALLPAGAAHAYCRTASCMVGTPRSAAVCTPSATDDCGVVIAWPGPCLEFSVQENASKKVTFAQTEETLKTAFTTWMNAACPGGGTPRILVAEGPAAVCNKHDYNPTGGNANVVLYDDDAWPYEGSSNTLALTTMTYALDTGAIYDADMELNTADINFTVGDTNVDFDLLSVVTHETGHLLGLAHSHDTTATMSPAYAEHSTSLRHLSADDIAGICAIYPPGGTICSCDPTPRRGFSPLCAAQQNGGIDYLAAVCQGSPPAVPTTAVDAGSPRSTDDGGSAAPAANDAGNAPAVIGAKGGCAVAPGRSHAGCAGLVAWLLAAYRRRRRAA